MLHETQHFSNRITITIIIITITRPVITGHISQVLLAIAKGRMDKEVLRDIWQGELPLCFKLHPDDVCGMHRPEPYYMMVPRITYFPIVLDRVVKYFNRFMDNDKHSNDDMWLDYDGQPIKWQHPIGLSWDLFGSSYELPWRLIIHFSDFPSKDLVRCNTKGSIKTNFMSSIKEADALKHKGSVIKNMLEKDQNQLWSSLVNNKFDQFCTINKRLMEKLDNELFRYIPYRLYFSDYSYVQKIVRPCTIEKQIFHNSEKKQTSQQQTATHLPAIYDTDIVINKLHKCSHSASEIEEANKSKDTEHRCSTMLDLIQVSFFNRMDDLLMNPQKKDGDRSELPEMQQQQQQSLADKEQSCDESNQSDLIDVKLFKYRFLSHGIEIPFDTPLQWLSEHLSYPDNFLHICAVSKSSSTTYI